MTSSSKIRRPSLWLYLTEGFRSIIENVLSYRFRSRVKRNPKADGHRIMVIPGFLTSDFSTGPLRKFLNNNGYQSFGWGLGTNLGELEDIDRIIERLQAWYQESPEPISLIGWSLGGVYAREIAKQHPQIIRQVITMGSPFNGITEPNNASWIYRLLHPGSSVETLEPEWLSQLPDPAPVPTTALYSKKDGIVNWRVCMEEVEDGFHQNVQVDSSHLGFGVNETVLKIIADRLPYSAQNWELF